MSKAETNKSDDEEELPMWARLDVPPRVALVHSLDAGARMVFDALVNVAAPQRTLLDLQKHIIKAMGGNITIVDTSITGLKSYLNALVGLGLMPVDAVSLTAKETIPRPSGFAFAAKGEADRYVTAMHCRKTTQRVIEGWAEAYQTRKVKFIIEITGKEYNVGYRAGWDLEALVRTEELAKIGLELGAALTNLVGKERKAACDGEVVEEPTWSFEGVMRVAASQWMGQLIQQARAGHSTSGISNLVDQIKAEAFAKAIDEFKYVFTRVGVKVLGY